MGRGQVEGGTMGGLGQWSGRLGVVWIGDNISDTSACCNPMPLPSLALDLNILYKYLLNVQVPVSTLLVCTPSTEMSWVWENPLQSQGAYSKATTPGLLLQGYSRAVWLSTTIACSLISGNVAAQRNIVKDRFGHWSSHQTHPRLTQYDSFGLSGGEVR